MAPVRTLAVRCTDWPVVALGRPPDVAVAVVFANRVVSANPAARADGVVPGLRRREAQSRCPSVELHERDESQEAREFEAVLAALEDLAPRLEVVESGLCLVPTLGPSRYHGGDRSLAEKASHAVRSALAPSMITTTRIGIGIADGPRAATLVATEAVRSSTGSPGSGPPGASGMSGVSGSPCTSGAPIVVGSGATAAFLSSLPVRVLETLGREPADMVDVLRRLGLRTLGRFAALEASDVLARFGAQGADLHRLVNGAERLPPQVSSPPVDLRCSTAFDPPVEQVDRAAFSAKALADELHSALGARGLACTRVLVVAETEVGDRIERLWRADGALSASAISQRVRWQLEGWLGTGRSRSRCTGGISRLELVPDEVRPDTGLQLGFWGGASEAGERALRALARVQALVGAEAVLVPEWQGGRAPGEQYRLIPLDAVDLHARSERGPAPWPGALPSPSPSMLWSRPRQVEVLDSEGRAVAVGGRGLISSPPVHVRFAPEASPASVRAWAGPWCVDERWWDALAHRRRARVQVVLDDAAHLLTLEDGRWWLEATYD